MVLSSILYSFEATASLIESFSLFANSCINFSFIFSSEKYEIDETASYLTLSEGLVESFFIVSDAIFESFIAPAALAASSEIFLSW